MNSNRHNLTRQRFPQIQIYTYGFLQRVARVESLLFILSLQSQSRSRSHRNNSLGKPDTLALSGHELSSGGYNSGLALSESNISVPLLLAKSGHKDSVPILQELPRLVSTLTSLVPFQHCSNILPNESSVWPLIVPLPSKSPARMLQPVTLWWTSCCFTFQ